MTTYSPQKLTKDIIKKSDNNKNQETSYTYTDFKLSYSRLLEKYYKESTKRYKN